MHEEEFGKVAAENFGKFGSSCSHRELLLLSRRQSELLLLYIGSKLQELSFSEKIDMQTSLSVSKS